MNAETIIRELETKGIRFSLHKAEVICSGPPDILTPDLIETLRQRKPEIREYLELKDIGAIVSHWDRARRLEYAGRCGRASRGRRLEDAMREAFADMRDYPKRN